MEALDDFVKAGNQGGDPNLYEVENQAIDPERVLWSYVENIAPWFNRVIVDLGCGSGFWLPKYAAAARVVGIEPDSELLPLAQNREGAAEVLYGSAEHIPLPDSSVDVVHARFAYFFPHPQHDCAPGLREVQRVLSPGGSLVVIDNDHEAGEFAALLSASAWAESQGEGTYIENWWHQHGATSSSIMSSWQFRSRADLEAVLRLEFPASVADDWLSSHPDRLALSYSYKVHHFRKQ